MPCEVCGCPVRSDNKYGVCIRNPECRREYQRRWKGYSAADMRTCELCGGPIVRTSKYGVCGQNPECLREWRKRAKEATYATWRAANPEKVRQYGRDYRVRYPDRADEAVRAYRQRNPEKVRERTRKYREVNHDKLLARDRARSYRPRDKERARVGALRYLHGMTQPDWDAMWDAQDGRCYLCTGLLDRARSRATVIDHDHACCTSPKTCSACRRGLVHNRCNVLIGFANDDPDELRRIADNLECAQAAVEVRRSSMPRQDALWEAHQPA